MPSITLDEITLTGDLIWSDEFQWTSIARSSDYGLTGALIVEESIKQDGRPITLECKPESQSELAGSDNLIWVYRSDVVALYAKASTPGLEMTLTFSDGRIFNVMFRDDGFEARPVLHIAPHQNTDPYYFTIKLVTI